MALRIAFFRIMVGLGVITWWKTTGNERESITDTCSNKNERKPEGHVCVCRMLVVWSPHYFFFVLGFDFRILYHLSHGPSIFCFSYFFLIGSHVFAWPGWSAILPISTSQVPGIKGARHSAQPDLFYKTSMLCCLTPVILGRQRSGGLLYFRRPYLGKKNNTKTGLEEWLKL
jgi:hypothetical protein